MSTETRWCPICATDFRARRFRRTLLFLLLLAAGVYYFRDRLLPLIS